MKINLNNEQQNIFNELHNFVFNKSNKTKLYLLTGLAGTGKTFLISYFLTLHELKNKKIAVTGCTNKAVGVLESSFLKTLDNYKITNNTDNTDNTDNENKNENNDTKNEISNGNGNENSNYSRLTFLTIHKLLQIKRKIDSNGEEIFESSIDENNIKITSKSIFFYDLIIVDEVSMLSKDLTLQILRLHQKIKGKIIFLGDKAQLPPVREPESHIFELAGTQIPQGSLQKIMRSGDQIIDFVNSIRILIDNHQHKVPFKKLANNISPNDTISRISLFRNEDEWFQKYLEHNSETDQIILCYTNKKVDYLNRKIRKILYKTEKDDYVPDEKIIFNNPYHLKNNQFKYDSSQMMKIKSSLVDYIEINEFNLDDILNIKFPVKMIDSSNESLYKLLISTPSMNCSTENYNINYQLKHSICMLCNRPSCLYSIVSHNINGNLTVKDDEKLTTMINFLRNTYKNKKYKIWMLLLDNDDLIYVIHSDDKEKYEKDIENLKKYLRDINTYITNTYSLKDHCWQKVVLQLWEFYYYSFIDQFAKINYGNAITTHRSQGSTYKRVYVDLIDIIKWNDSKKEAYQCLYTAVTRASENLEMLF